MEARGPFTEDSSLRSIFDKQKKETMIYKHSWEKVRGTGCTMHHSVGDADF